jgi:hypothetical protein
MSEVCPFIEPPLPKMAVMNFEVAADRSIMVLAQVSGPLKFVVGGARVTLFPRDVELVPSKAEAAKSGNMIGQSMCLLCSSSPFQAFIVVCRL